VPSCWAILMCMTANMCDPNLRSPSLYPSAYIPGAKSAVHDAWSATQAMVVHGRFLMLLLLLSSSSPPQEMMSLAHSLKPLVVAVAMSPMSHGSLPTTTLPIIVLSGAGTLHIVSMTPSRGSNSSSGTGGGGPTTHYWLRLEDSGEYVFLQVGGYVFGGA
jgi:hypothetical protein